jgi:PPOX class probable F420-dependent enzyme
MAAQVPDSAKDLLERPITVGVVTVMPDGQPQATPVWFDYEDGYFRFNTAEGRQKERNLNRDSKVTFLIIDPQNPAHWLEVRGHVVEAVRESEGSSIPREHINNLSLKYTGSANFRSMVEGEQRVMYKIEADKINGR